MPRDLLEFDSGFLDNYVYTVQQAVYNYDGKYNDGQTLLLILDGQARTDDGNVEQRREWFSCGNKWANREGGLIAVHESNDPEARFHRSTDVAKFLQRLAELGLGQRLREGVGDGRGYFNAKTFEGLVLRMKQEASKNPISGDERTHVMPVAVEGAGAAAAQVAPVAAAPAPAAPVAQGGLVSQVQAPAQPYAPPAPPPAVPQAPVQQQMPVQQPGPIPAAPAGTMAAHPANGGGDPVRAQLVALATGNKQRGGTFQEFIAAATQVAGWDRFAEEMVSPESGIYSQA